MKISVFTPSHNPKWLNEAADSLHLQTNPNWEWIVLLNNGAEWEPPHDSRIKVHHAKPWVKGVGALKAKAAELCDGEILLELDHDDLLMPEALSKVAEAFENPEVGFVFSDFAHMNEDGTPNLTEFDLSYGWSYYQDGEWKVTRTKSAHPHNVAYIWYAPNHLRAFRKSAYESAGGYNQDLEILDDQDLMARLYLVTKFLPIHENLYLQRIHGSQTQADPILNPKIQEETVRMYDRTIQSLVLKWARDNGLHALDLGGAHNSAPGFTSVDLHDADITGDIFDVFGNMEDNSVGVIRAFDFIEHISDKIRLWNEMYRVLADGGMILSMTPSTDGRGAFQDPTHIAYYNQNSFWYLIDENYRRYVPELKVNFQSSRLMTFFPSAFHQNNNIPYVLANLIALKGGERYGGRLGV